MICFSSFSCENLCATLELILVLFLNRCQLYDKETEMKEMKEHLKELVGLLRQSETRRKEVEKDLKLREQAVAVALATSASVR